VEDPQQHRVDGVGHEVDRNLLPGSSVYEGKGGGEGEDYLSVVGKGAVLVAWGKNTGDLITFFRELDLGV
jgi:hypothetical protein